MDWLAVVYQHNMALNQPSHFNESKGWLYLRVVSQRLGAVEELSEKGAIQHHMWTWVFCVHPKWGDPLSKIIAPRPQSH